MGIKWAAAVVVPSVLAVSCVSSGKYDALNHKHQETVQKMKHWLKLRDAKAAELVGQLEQERGKGSKLQAELVSSQRTFADESTGFEAQISKLQGELADVVKARSALRASVSDMKQALAELEARRRAAEARVAEFRGLIERFKPLIDTGRLKVKVARGRMVVELATDILFPSGSATLSKPGADAVQEVAKVLAAVPNRRFQVEGHTDNVPIRTKSFPSNWALASARAINVVTTMIDAGMPADRVSGASMGEYAPARGNDSDEGRAANRRIEIAIIPDLSSLPGFDELTKLADPAG